MHAPADFEVQTSNGKNGLVVAPRGEIDLATVGLLKDAVEREHKPGERLVIDLRNVAFMDTSGLRAVLSIAERAEAEGSTFRVVRGPSAVQRVFEVAGIERRLPFVDRPEQDPPKS